MLAFVLKNDAAAAQAAQGVGVVVIDAGHGGKFPGARYGGLCEKELTLKVALRLGALIEQQMPGVKVVYTRTTDRTLGETLADDLQARANIANKAGGDIFVSIHANAARSTSAQGVETLIMGESSKEQRYNESALFDNNREDLIDMSDERTAAIVRAYIQNLQFTYGEYSMAMARCIQNNYQKAGRTSRGIKPQLLRVLYATDMPGVLTEIGFMSNAQESAFLRSDEGQEQIAQSLFRAVKEYSDYVLGTRMAEEMPAQVSGVENVGVATADSVTESATALAVQAESAESAPPIRKPIMRSPALNPEPAPAAEAVETEEQPDTAVKTVKAVASAKKSAPATPREDVAASVRYAVQIAASVKTVSTSSSQFKAYRGKVRQYTSEGNFRYKYCVGEFETPQAAQRKFAEVRRLFPEAFVVKCCAGKIVK
ncbi:MAG: N-acetylmuramoyl-L-alanine amidase [Alistipes sp.]